MDVFDGVECPKRVRNWCPSQEAFFMIREWVDGTVYCVLEFPVPGTVGMVTVLTESGIVVNERRSIGEKDS